MGTNGSGSMVEKFLAALDEQSFLKSADTQGSVRWYIEYYKKRAPRRRLAFRVSGFALLFLSISLPFLTSLAPEADRIARASELSLVIAIVAAQMSFFNWQKSWQGYTQAQMSLQFALSQWELDVARSRAMDDESGLKHVQTSLERLMKIVVDTISAETTQYFEGVKVPDVGKVGQAK